MKTTSQLTVRLKGLRGVQGSEELSVEVHLSQNQSCPLKVAMDPRGIVQEQQHLLGKASLSLPVITLPNLCRPFKEWKGTVSAL